MNTTTKDFPLRFITFVACLLLSVSSSLAQQDNNKQPGPRQSAICRFSDGKTVKTEYLSQRRMGQKLFGESVPYGEVWRPSANAATTFVTDSDLNVDDQEVPAGSYALFAIPAVDRWTLIISKKTDESTPYSRNQDLLRVGMKVAKTADPVENFTIAYFLKDGKCTLKMTWENTEASVDVAEKKLCWPTTTPLTYQCADQ